MKILWHSNAPWCPTGYGTQTAIWVPRLASLGHEVAISAFHGLQGGPIDWQGHRVYPAGIDGYGSDVVGMHAIHFGADLIIALMDQWALGADTLDGKAIAFWMPVDCTPLGRRDNEELRLKHKTARQVWQIAMSQFGQRQLEDAGFGAFFVPHGLDSALWVPPAGGETLRQSMGLGSRFVVAVNAANLSMDRKNYPGMFAAFARLHRAHDDAVLIVHALQTAPTGLNLPLTAARQGIPEDAVKFSAQYLMASGLVGPEQLRGTYGAAHLLANWSLAEGFGLPMAEAMLCGTPVGATRASAMPEVVGPGGWLTDGEPHYKPGHDADWAKPADAAVYKVMERAYEHGAAWHAKAKAARPHALGFDADKVLSEYWQPVLKIIEAQL